MDTSERIKRVCFCPVCSDVLLSEKTFHAHMRNEHRSTYPTMRYENCKIKVCFICQKNFVNVRMLSEHFKDEHNLKPMVNEGTFTVSLRRVEMRNLRGMKVAFS